MWREKLQVKRFGRYVPIIGWVRSYQRAWPRDDLVSGVVVGAIMIPVAMAYAQMAGVPVQAGLYSAIVGMTAYAYFATSRHLEDHDQLHDVDHVNCGGGAAGRE